jgi:hypothetical protein
MNTIKIKKFKSKLFRANKNLFNKNDRLIYKANTNKNILASVNYKNAPLKYFTLNRKEVNGYTKEGRTYIKNWNVVEELNLVDILDLSTRRSLEDKFKNDTSFKEAIKGAFPINNNNKVGRVSSNVDEDNIVLNRICELGYDGYYMEKAGESHSEVGLCKKAFKKLKLISKPEMKSMPRKTRKRTRAQYEAEAEAEKNRNTEQNTNPIPKFSLLN